MKVLVITQKTNAVPNQNIYYVFDAVAGLKNKCDVLVIGDSVADNASIIAEHQLVNQVLTLDHPSLHSILAENIAKQIADIASAYTHVLVAADSFGKNLLPRIAGIMGIGQISEIVKVVSPNVFKRFTYAGNVLVEVESLEDIKLLTVRTINFVENTAKSSAAAPIKALEYLNPVTNKISVVTRTLVSQGVDLSSAKVIVTGGRSLGSKENFVEYIRTLATKLSAGVGASRAAVEAGYAPNDCQIGQTGKVVAPDVYLAIGISGAVQHIAGMKNSRTVIAINLDKTAPIFEHADYGLVDDLFDVIPELLRKI